MYDFYTLDALNMLGDFEGKAYPWSTLLKASGVKIKNGIHLPPANKERIKYFFEKQGVKEVIFK